jgi:hypothetical protein
MNQQRMVCKVPSSSSSSSCPLEIPSVGMADGIISELLGISEDGFFPTASPGLLVLMEGLKEGALVGFAVVGGVVGRFVVGGVVGFAVGVMVGSVVGFAVGLMVGLVVGVMVGSCETVGATLGTLERVGTTEGDVEGRWEGV